MYTSLLVSYNISEELHTTFNNIHTSTSTVDTPDISSQCQQSRQKQSHSPPKRETCSLTHHSQTRAMHTSQYESHSSPHYDRDSEGVLIQVYHPNLHRTHITHTNGYILRSHALIQHTLVFAPLVVSIPTVICQQHNSLEPSQYVLQIYWHTLVLFRIRALMQHYYATYTQYDVLLYLTWMQYICSVLWNTLV